MDLIDGTRIRQLIERAQVDPDLRVRLFHCPDKAIAQVELSADEARAIRTGDLSSVDLDEETLEAGRLIFTDLPPIEGQAKAAAQHLLFSSQHIAALCA